MIIERAGAFYAKEVMPGGKREESERGEAGRQKAWDKVTSGQDDSRKGGGGHTHEKR